MTGAQTTEFSTTGTAARPAERVLLVSLMKSGTHLIQELMVALGYGMYGTSRITPDIRPVLDDDIRRQVARLVYDDHTYERITSGDQELFDTATTEAWEALGWAWQQRLGMPLASRYGVAVINAPLVEQALRRTASVPFAQTPPGVCWVVTGLDLQSVDGRFLQEWTETGEPRIIFMHRDPRDTVLSMVNFLSGKTVQGFGNYSDFLVFNRILSALPDLTDKLTYALTDPGFPGVDDHARAYWLLNHPNVCKVSFEELVGPAGGGSAEAQQAAVARVVRFLGSSADAESLVDKLFRRDSFSFFKGQIGAWREVFTPEHQRLVDSRLGEMIRLYGYA